MSLTTSMGSSQGYSSYYSISSTQSTENTANTISTTCSDFSASLRLNNVDQDMNTGMRPRGRSITKAKVRATPSWLLNSRKVDTINDVRKIRTLNVQKVRKARVKLPVTSRRKPAKDPGDPRSANNYLRKVDKRGLGKANSKSLLRNLHGIKDLIQSDSRRWPALQISNDTISPTVAAFIKGCTHDEDRRLALQQLDTIWSEMGIHILTFHEGTPDRLARTLEVEGPHGTTVTVLHHIHNNLNTALEILERLGDISEEMLKPGAWDNKKMFEYGKLLRGRFEHTILPHIGTAALKIAECLKRGEPIEVEDANTEPKKQLQALWRQLVNTLQGFMVKGSFGPLLIYEKVAASNELLIEIKEMIQSMDPSIAFEKLLSEEDLASADYQLKPTKEGVYYYVRTTDAIELHTHIVQVRTFLMQEKKAKNIATRIAAIESLNGLWSFVRTTLEWFNENGLSFAALSEFHSVIKVAMEHANALLHKVKSHEKPYCVWDKALLDRLLEQLEGLGELVRESEEIKDIRRRMGILSRMLA